MNKKGKQSIFDFSRRSTKIGTPISLITMLQYKNNKPLNCLLKSKPSTKITSKILIKLIFKTRFLKICRLKPTPINLTLTIIFMQDSEDTIVKITMIEMNFVIIIMIEKKSSKMKVITNIKAASRHVNRIQYILLSAHPSRTHCSLALSSFAYFFCSFSLSPDALLPF